MPFLLARQESHELVLHSGETRGSRRAVAQKVSRRIKAVDQLVGYGLGAGENRPGRPTRRLSRLLLSIRRVAARFGVYLD